MAQSRLRPVARCSGSRRTVRVVDQGFVGTRLAGVQRLFQRIEHEVRMHGTAHAPPDDASGKNVDDKSHIYPSLPSRDIGEVRDPQLIGTPCLELLIDPIQRARRFAVADRGAHHLAAHDMPQALTLHESFDRTTGHHDDFAVQLPPDFVGTIDLQVGLPDALDLRHQHLVTPHSLAALFRIAPQGNMAPVARRGNLQLPADRLDPEGITMLVDERPQDLNRRSSSAWAKNALASLSISLALRSSLTSRSSSLTRFWSAVVGPSRWPVSRSC